MTFMRSSAVIAVLGILYFGMGTASQLAPVPVACGRAVLRGNKIRQ